MGKLVERLRKMFTREKPDPRAALEEMRRVFRAKFHAFKLLLYANNTALQLMTEMEATLNGRQSFGMTFVRGHVTAVCVNVFNLIRHLNDLAGQKYAALYPVFEEIKNQIDACLEQRRPPPLKDLVLPLSRVTKDLADGVGSKMANLGEILAKIPEVTVPDGFVITAQAYERFLAHNHLQEEINRRLQALEVTNIGDLYRQSSEIQMLIIGAEVPEDVARAIAAAYADLEARAGGPVRVALRSSAIGEDAVETSFAGQYRSELNVSRDYLIPAYKEILASKYALTAVSYRLHKGLRDEDVPMCVGVMRMVEARAGGVMYTRDPSNPRREVVLINAVHGLAKTVVDGSVTPDLFEVSRKEPLSLVNKIIREKRQRAVCLPTEGVVLEEDPQGREPALTDAEALALARVALKLEEHFQSPQDIEWTLDAAGHLFILQSRPLQETAVFPEERPLRTLEVGHPVLLAGGETASPGVGAGPAYLVKNNLDLLQFPEGAVLVSALAHPTWASILPRAAAVVTDRGSLTGHLANVAREFRVPALFNTGKATQKIAPGTVITVDADGRLVYGGRVEALVARRPARKPLMEGTPVYETLKAVMAYITPLNLTDPESPEFTAANCRTLHDITRYAHEVSVKEMFALDRHRELARYFIKRLAVQVPMDWWVLNLGDGFKEDLPDKEVTLENIASIPMLALWEGITAVPWEGPPPVDTRGFMSIVLGAATDPHLASAGGTVYGNQNYFMISKYFCNLTSRLGFHFSTVEALTGEEPFENYLRFTFKGGAADQVRRGLRARLVAELLEQFDFKVDVKEDALFARLEGEPLPYMLSRLKVLGYVTIHTRQLDMVMLNPAEVARYREKMLGDLQRLLAGHSPA